MLHIASLQITLFLRHFKPLIEQGKLYLSCPPLFTVKEGKETHYIANESDLNNFFTSRVLRKLGIKARSTSKYANAIKAMTSYYNSVNLISEIFTLPVDIIEGICFKLDEVSAKKNIIDVISERKVKVIGGISEIYYDKNPYYVATEHFISEFEKVKTTFEELQNDNVVEIVNEILGCFENETLYNIAKTVFNYSQKGLEITYLKGLGEMSAEELWETTMNPQTRTLLRVVIQDDHLATENCSVLMGPSSKYAERRREIMDAAFANIDINQVDIQ